MHEKMKAVVNKKRCHISNCIKDEDGNVLMGQDQIKGGRQSTSIVYIQMPKERTNQS